MQAIEKNHFPDKQNRHILPPMTDKERARTRQMMLAIAAVLALATLAPVAVLAA